MTTTPEGFVIENCRTETCQAPIVWARTKTGKLMPVDAEPSADGNVQVYVRQGIVHAKVLTSAEAEWVAAFAKTLFAAVGGVDPVPVLRTSHFVTCSRAADWRSKR